MRLIRVTGPPETSGAVAKIAFAAGISKVSRMVSESLSSSGEIETKHQVSVRTSTPKGKLFIDGLLAADFYSREDYSITVRSPRAVVTDEDLREVTVPLPEPATDILQDLLQFSHITYGFVIRVIIAGMILAYGIVQQQLLMMIAGLLFLPLLPLLLGIVFGAWTRRPELTFQSLLAFLLGALLVLGAGALVGALAGPPVKFDDFPPLGAGFLITLIVGIAAGLAHIDDVGKREMIGLAATAQIATLLSWFGVCLTAGFPETAGNREIGMRAASFFINLLTILAASLAVYIFTGAASPLAPLNKNK